jgi:hypothetical protein
MFESEAKVGVRALLAMIIGVAALTGLSVLGVTIYQAKLGTFDRPPDATRIEAPIFKGPMLEIAEGEVLDGLRAEEDALLGGFAWIDREGGIARIPIESAMRVLAARTSTGGGGP